MTPRFNPDLMPTGSQLYFAANPNVLVVEDNRLMVLLFLGILVDVGFNVTFVLDGVAAIETLKQRPIDFIILDIRLPGMDGFELYERLQVNPETQMIPVLITTALNGQYRFLKIRSRGVRHYLARPFTENELLEAILVLLKKKRADKNEKTDP